MTNDCRRSDSPCLSPAPDLLCSESSTTIFDGDGEYFSPEYSSGIESPPPEAEESIADLLEVEKDPARISFDFSNQSVDATIRSESVVWILKVHKFYGFQPLTAYLSVNYFDRFLLYHHSPKMSGWPLQLLSVACLSLAAKMEEPQVPSLLDLQVEDAKFIFEPGTVQRMELHVLGVLDWRLRPGSPFCYHRFLALKIDPTGIYTEFLTTRVNEIILETIKEASFLEYRPSCIATAAMVCAANDLPKFSYITVHHAESWCDGLHQDEITSCHRLIRKIMFDFIPRKVLPQLRVTPRANFLNSSDSSSSASSPSSFKRRKLI